MERKSSEQVERESIIQSKKRKCTVEVVRYVII